MAAEHHNEFLEGAQGQVAPEARFWQHAITPLHIGVCVDPSASATGVGSCGDRAHIALRIEKGVITEIKCLPRGCIYTLVCASALGALAEGCPLENALRIEPEDVARELEGLPDDHMHCARLVVNTLGEAIAEYYRLKQDQALPR